MAIAFDSSGSTAVTAGATSATVDITSAAVGAWCYLWVALGLTPGTIAASGWTSVTATTDGTAAGYAVLRRQKQVGDGTFTVTFTSAKGVLVWASYTGLNTVTPDEGAASTNNGTTSRSAVPTPSATPTAAGRWAVAFFGVRTTNSLNKPISWTPTTVVERVDVDNNAAGSSPWLGAEIADSNGAVAVSSQSYTSTHSPAAESHDGSAILFLIPAVTVTGDASLAGSGTLTAAGAPVVTGAASLTGSGSATAAATVTSLGAASLAASGALTAQGRVDVFGTAALAASGVLMADGHVPGFNVPRPDFGTITRPSTGTVVRPNTGLVLRPRTEV